MLCVYVYAHYICISVIYVYVFIFFIYIHSYTQWFVYLQSCHILNYISYFIEQTEKEGFHLLTAPRSAVGLTCLLPCQPLAGWRGTLKGRSLAVSPRPLLGCPQEGK